MKGLEWLTDLSTDISLTRRAEKAVKYIQGSDSLKIVVEYDFKSLKQTNSTVSVLGDFTLNHKIDEVEKLQSINITVLSKKGRMLKNYYGEDYRASGGFKKSSWIPISIDELEKIDAVLVAAFKALKNEFCTPTP